MIQYETEENIRNQSGNLPMCADSRILRMEDIYAAQNRYS